MLAATQIKSLTTETADNTACLEKHDRHARMAVSDSYGFYYLSDEKAEKPYAKDRRVPKHLQSPPGDTTKKSCENGRTWNDMSEDPAVSNSHSFCNLSSRLPLLHLLVILHRSLTWNLLQEIQKTKVMWQWHKIWTWRDTSYDPAVSNGHSILQSIKQSTSPHLNVIIHRSLTCSFLQEIQVMWQRRKISTWCDMSSIQLCQTVAHSAIYEAIYLLRIKHAASDRRRRIPTASPVRTCHAFHTKASRVNANKCHASHRKAASMSPCATPATVSKAAMSRRQIGSITSSPLRTCHESHAQSSTVKITKHHTCHTQWPSMSHRGTPATDTIRGVIKNTARLPSRARYRNATSMSPCTTQMDTH